MTLVVPRTLPCMTGVCLGLFPRTPEQERLHDGPPAACPPILKNAFKKSRW